jgi:predicted lysophospholipase L1 biosynthesis ABC-type transport system permease subunit
MTRFIAETVRDLGSDVRFALRMMRRQPVHAVASALTLALGIGATTAVIAVVDATLLRRLHHGAQKKTSATASSAISSACDPARDVRSIQQRSAVKFTPSTP